MKYNGTTNITYEQIIKLLKNGICSIPKKKGLFSFAHEGGMYLGAPGKEIHFALSSLSEKEIVNVVRFLVSHYPKQVPYNHVKWAACIRYIYGCFEKQGVLRSKSDKKRMIKEDADWNLPNRFMNLMKREFERAGNKYGLALWYEMAAHRIGDRAVIDNNPKLLDQMLNYYLESQRLALQIKSWKHTFTPFYWAACYYFDMGIRDKAIELHKKSLRRMNKYCPDARPGYREKVQNSLQQLKKMMSPQEWNSWYPKFKKRIHNKCLRKVIK